MKRKDILMLGLPYLAFNLFLLLIYLVNFGILYGFLSNHLSYLYDNYGVDGFYLLIIIMYFTFPIGFLFIFISGFYLCRLKIRKSIIFGIVGTIIYILTVIFFTIAYYQGRELKLLSMIFLWLFTLIVNLIVYLFLRSEKNKMTFEDEMTIKKIVLDLGTKYTRLEVREISEKCGYDSDSIIVVINSMIMNNEIYAEFFKSSNTVSFDQQANIDEIDELMAVFKDWEDNHYTKKEVQEE